MCKNCNTETSNPNFCSRSCSAMYNNRVKPKRIPEGNCSDCNTPIVSRNKRCMPCRTLFLKEKDVRDRTLADMVYGKHTSAHFAHVRYYAKYILRQRPKICVRCGYSKHVEVCHIQAISSFPLDTKISIVNHPDNLELLCPNCHWESEHMN